METHVILGSSTDLHIAELCVQYLESRHALFNDPLEVWVEQSQGTNWIKMLHEQYTEKHYHQCRGFLDGYKSGVCHAST